MAAPEVKVFYTVDGRPVEGNNRVPFTDISWSQGWNEDGTLGLSIRWHRLFARWRARRKIRPWLHCVAVIENGVVKHWGPVTSRRWEGLTLKIDVGDGFTLLSKRLVLNRLLKSQWVDGEVVIDEDNPSPEWVLQIAGQSLAGIGAALIRETLEWGPLLIDSPAGEEGTRVRTYQCWDFATVRERLIDLGNVEDGPLLQFEGYIRADGHLRARYVSGEGGHLWSWVLAAPGQKVSLVSVDEDGESMATEAFALGGRSEDVVLVAKSTSAALTAEGWPVMQVADSSHSTISRLETLKGITGLAVRDGSMLPESYQLKASANYDVRIGDYIDLEVDDRYLGKRLVSLIVVAVSRDASEWQTVSAFPRENDFAEADE
jgi:hypothetical protein